MPGCTLGGMSEQGGAAPAGWYADPQIPGQHRWWDGVAWGPTAPVIIPARRPSNDFGQTSLFLSIAAVVIAFVSIPLALILALLGVALAIRGVILTHRTGAGRGTWIAGFVVSGLVILYPVLFGF